VVAIFGIGCGLAVLIFVKEPPRGRFDPAKKTEATSDSVLLIDSAHSQSKPPSKLRNLANGLLALIQNPCTRWLLVGGFFRFWQTTIISFYCIKYFDFYGKSALFGVLNAVVILVGGLTSSIVAGYISDKYEVENFKTKSYVCTALSALGFPMFCVIFLTHGNFYFSMSMLFLENLLCEGWMAPCIAMIQTVIDVRYKAVSVGVFFFGTAIA